MTDLVEGVPVGGDPPPVRLEEVILSVLEAGDSGSPVLDFAPKKMLRRARGRPAKSRPKSPLMRMAEMRKNGLRGRALRQVGKLGSEEYDTKNKGKKGGGNRGADLLFSFSEIGRKRIRLMMVWWWKVLKKLVGLCVRPIPQFTQQIRCSIFCPRERAILRGCL